MSHFYFRLVLGFVWLAAAIVSIVTASIPTAILNMILCIVFFSSAYSIRKKKNGRRR